MAATFHFCEDNGAATGSPAHGTTRSGFGADVNYATEVDWKNEDSCSEAGGIPYSASPIYYGNNSFQKYQYAKLTGSFTLISTGLFAHTAGVLGAGLTLKGDVTSTYATPATTDAGFSTDLTPIILISAGQTVLFSTTGPEDASPTSDLSAPGYSQYMPSQLLTTTSAAPGDIGAITLTFQYAEN